MLSFMFLDFFNDAVNAVFRNISPGLRCCLILAFLALSALFLALSLNKKKDSADKEPIKYGRLALAIVCMAMAGLYALIY